MVARGPQAFEGGHFGHTAFDGWRERAKLVQGHLRQSPSCLHRAPHPVYLTDIAHKTEMDVLVVISNCPEALNPAAGVGPVPIRAIRYRR